MSTTRAEQFIDALGHLERDRDTDPLVALFAEKCTLQNVTVGDDHHGKDGAESFWTDDRKLFDTVESDFRNVIVDGDRVALEWARHGTARDGGSVDYVGVSIVEFADEGIVRFMGYFHPRELGRQTQ